MTDRLEPRTPNTAACPDTDHQHRWRRRRPELTVGVDRVMAYDADERGAVSISEEALAQLMRLAGFTPNDDAVPAKQLDDSPRALLDECVCRPGCPARLHLDRCPEENR